ncbi:MAG TPA: type I addiction module toxin, SymE family [Prolixibacteraceae bacterium]|nr:type I addiction module toxin, SymE family [Prolixibacteraceae bacterium]
MTRIIKLQPHYRQGKWDMKPKVVPKLTLQGNWLQDAGFQPSKLIKVAVSDGKLVITSVE